MKQSPYHTMQEAEGVSTNETTLTAMQVQDSTLNATAILQSTEAGALADNIKPVLACVTRSFVLTPCLSVVWAHFLWHKLASGSNE
jgi:hypothetical protein